MEWRGAYVGGEEIAQPRNAEVVEVQSPWDPKWIGRSFLSSRELAEDAVESSLRAFEVWRRSNSEERSSLLTRIADEIAHRKERLAELLVYEIGKPIVWAEGEVARLEVTFRLAAQLASIERPQTLDLSYDPRGKDFAGSVQREPRGQSWLSSLTTGLTISLRTSSRPRWPPATRSFSSPPPCAHFLARSRPPDPRCRVPRRRRQCNEPLERRRAMAGST